MITPAQRTAELLFSEKVQSAAFLNLYFDPTGGELDGVTLRGFSQGLVLAVTHIDRCFRPPAVHRCGHSLARPS